MWCLFCKNTSVVNDGDICTACKDAHRSPEDEKKIDEYVEENSLSNPLLK